MNRLLVAAIAGLLTAGVASSSFAQTSAAAVESPTAGVHALMAQDAKTVAEAHTHLHHVINCLVGPGGKGFDASAGNPCQGKGNGALPDTAGNADAQSRLREALAAAQAGLQAQDLATIQSDAGKVFRKLTEAFPYITHGATP